MQIRSLANRDWRTEKDLKAPAFLNAEEGKKVLNFYHTFPGYCPTPLVSLDNLARYLGVGKILVKDESHRFGLNAFKALGATYAIARCLCRQLGTELEKVTFDYLRSRVVQEKLGVITFATATDGNHGRGVAWAAQQLGQRAVVYLPKGSAIRRVEAIRETGAQVFVTEENYDRTVEIAGEEARKNGWQLVQDTAWSGYEEVPSWIMQGYIVMVQEALEEMKQLTKVNPSHLFLQAGVGSMPAAVLGYLVNLLGRNTPRTVIIEPDNAACIFASAQAGDGKPRGAEGDLATIMAGLACGLPNPIAWEILRDFADMYVTCPDSVAARGMRILANPLAADRKIVSGESGAVGTGLLSVFMQDEECTSLRRQLQLDQDSVVLLFSTEGDTDPENYRRVVWDGLHPTPLLSGNDKSKMGGRS